MPIWGYLYCIFFIFSCCFSLFDKNRLQRPYQSAGEIIDCLCGIFIFLIGFSIVHLEHADLISVLCFIYNFVWSYHAHRHYLDYGKFKSAIHKSAIEEHEKLTKKLTEINDAALAEGADPEELEVIEEAYDYRTTEKEALYFYNGVIVLLVVIFLPYFYVFLKSVGVIGN